MKLNGLYQYPLIPTRRCVPVTNTLCYHSFLSAALLVLENQDLQDSIKPQKVEFHSLNFNTTLHWQPGWAREARDALYFVQYKVYGQSMWQNKDECWGISSHVCDLTHETSDIQEPYYSRVRAALAGVYSNWTLSCRFTPWRETVIGPPTVTVAHSNKSITVKLQAPRSPYKRKRGSKIPMTNYYDLLYQVFIINNSLDGVRKIMGTWKEKVIEIQDLRPGVSYCIVAKMYMPMLDHSSAYSSRQCTVLQ
uniref:Interleukin-22 receptor subunit alpha-2 n=1 Tax=Cyanoderma ruficeps TaxID=181631 RepID=A0A8C3NXZ8_9PASS